MEHMYPYDVAAQEMGTALEAIKPTLTPKQLRVLRMLDESAGHTLPVDDKGQYRACERLRQHRPLRSTAPGDPEAIRYVADIVRSDHGVRAIAPVPSASALYTIGIPTWSAHVESHQQFPSDKIRTPDIASGSGAVIARHRAERPQAV